MTDLLERPLDDPSSHQQLADAVLLTLRPFQILTLRLRPASHD